MKIFIVGGTGLLGAAGAAELIKRGHSVCSIALPPMPIGANIPGQMDISLGNFMAMSDDELKEKMAGCEGFVFAAGVDERVEFKSPVYDSYFKYNIAPVARMLKIAKACNVKKAVILGSYFSYFAKVWPEKKLYDKHPYIRSRIDQEKVALSFSDDDMEVMVLELPYIFGTQTGRKPVWMILVDMLLDMKKNIYFPRGGTAMVTVKQVGEIIAGAIEKGIGGTCYPVGIYNKKWKDFLKIVNINMGCPEKKIITIPTFIYRINAYLTKRKYEKKGIEPGLDPLGFVDIMTADTFIDGKKLISEFKISDDDIDAAIGESIRFCLEIKGNEENIISMRAE